MGLLRQTVAYSQGIMGINIKVITQASQPCSDRELEDSKQPGPYRSWFVWLISLLDFTFPSWGTREAGTAAEFPVPAGERELGSCSSPWWDVHETPCPWTAPRSCSSGCAHIPNLCFGECSCPSHPAPRDPACSSPPLWLLKHKKSSPGKCPRWSKVLPCLGCVQATHRSSNDGLVPQHGHVSSSA